MEHKAEKKLLGAVIVFMIIVLLVLCAVLATGVRRVGRENSIASFQEFLTARRTRGPLSPSDADLIRPWMTFDYINQLFGLPPAYLKQSLELTDPRYPNLAITEYTESFATTTRTAFFDALKNAVSESTTSQQ